MPLNFFQNIQSALKLKALIVFALIHAGLILGIITVSRSSFPGGWDLTSSLFLASIICLYGGFILAVLFVLIPLLPWLKRAQKVETWTDRLMRDIPIILAQVPQVIALIQALVSAWNEAKGQTPEPTPPTAKSRRSAAES